MGNTVDKLRKTELSEKQIALCRLGQHSFLMKNGDVLIAFDPYLSASERRLVAPLAEAEELADFDFIFGSHDHSDHIDRPQLARMAHGKAVFVFPEAIADSITEVPRSKILFMKGDDEIEFGKLKISAVPGAHEFLEKNANGAYFNLGFAVKKNDICVYHSGDCCIYEGLFSRLKALAPDVMLLPVNGRDAERLRRNCIGNMTYQEAVDLAGSVAPGLVVPGHYDMFEGNLENPQLFVDYAGVKFPQLATGIMPPGEIKIFTKGKK